MKRALIFLRVAFLAAVAASVAFLAFAVRRGVDTDLMSLAGIGKDHALREASGAVSGIVVLIFEGDNADEVAKAATAAVGEFGGIMGGDPQEVLKVIGEHCAGLLSDGARSLLEAGSYDEAMKGALSRLFGPVPPVVSVKRDPFLFCSEYLESMYAARARGWTRSGGFLRKRHDGKEYAMLPVDALKVPQARLLELKREGELSVARADGVKVFCVGPAFHTAVATANSKREINVLSAVSVVAVLLIGFALFRSFRFAPLLVAAQLSAFAVASAALFAVFGRPHVITFIFGTSLIGLSVDYVYHALAGASFEKARGVLKPLTLSMLTTVGGFLPLVFAAVPTICQMAVFSTTGILAVYGFVVLFVVCGCSRRRDAVATSSCATGCGNGAVVMASGTAARRMSRDPLDVSRRKTAPILMLALVPALLGVPLYFTVDPSGFYRPDRYLAEGDRLFAATCGGMGARMAIVHGASLQEVLENEERAGVKGVSAMVPSLKRQRENAALKAKLYEAKGAEYSAATGIAVSKFDASSLPDDAFLDPEKAPDLSWMAKGWNGRSSATPVPVDFETDDPDVMVYSVRDALAMLLAQMTCEVLKLLGWSVLAMAVLFAALFRRRAFAYLFPVLCGFVWSFAALVLTRTPITVFAFIAVFVVSGLGVDYAIFYRSSERRGAEGVAMRRTVSFSFLTSLVGLGALAFTQFPVTRSMGIAFAGGLLGAYLAARACGFTREPRQPEKTSKRR